MSKQCLVWKIVWVLITNLVLELPDLRRLLTINSLELADATCFELSHAGHHREQHPPSTGGCINIRQVATNKTTHPVLLYFVGELQNEPSITSQTVDLGNSNHSFLRTSLSQGLGQLGSIVLAPTLHLHKFRRNHSRPLGGHRLNLPSLCFKAQSGAPLAICTDSAIGEPTNRTQRAIRRIQNVSNRLFHKSTGVEPEANCSRESTAQPKRGYT